MEVKVEGAPPQSGSVAKGQPAAEDTFGGLTVGQLLPEGAVGCKLLLHYDLGDAASGLHASGRTAAAVAEADGTVVGLLTENDIMRAFFEGAHVGSKLDEWFDSGMARGCDADLRRISVRPTAPLAEVADDMVANAIRGDCACHHVLVEGEDGHLWGVLSALDMVQALIRPETWGDAPTTSEQKEYWTRGAKTQWTTISMSVGDVMKPRDSVITCPPTSSLKDVLKVLLMTGQNSALIVDAHGIYGIVTPRDAVRAFADGLDSNIVASTWLADLQPAAGPRVVSSEDSLSDAAARMTAHNINHLVVVAPGTQEAIGTLSSFDLALCDKARMAPQRVHGRGAGPTVGELVSQDWHSTAVCNQGATLQSAAMLLWGSGRTSTALALEPGAPLRLLTENDLVRAYVFGWEPGASAESWLKSKLIPRSTVPEHVLVPPSVRLTEAAFLMLSAAKPGIDACHHLVVKGPKGCEGGWLGVFSALDVARGLTTIGSELEVARTGADRLRVRAAMKPLEALPTCKPSDTLQMAFKTLVDTRQNAALVTHGDGTYSLLTPRCCLQALAESVPPETTVADFLPTCGRGTVPETMRQVSCDMRLFDVAAVMTERVLHHLFVQDTKTGKLVGVLSSLDLARAIASVQSEHPFASLGWLWAAKGPGACTLW